MKALDKFQIWSACRRLWNGKCHRVPHTVAERVLKRIRLPTKPLAVLAISCVCRKLSSEKCNDKTRASCGNFLLLSSLAFADYIDKKWSVVGWTGEAWFVEPKNVIGQTQMFHKGEARGVFYGCDFAGQSSRRCKT